LAPEPQSSGNELVMLQLESGAERLPLGMRILTVSM
jgi:hypothetical protein